MPLNLKDLEEITKHPENYNIYIKEGVDGIQLNEHNAKMLACDNGLIVLPEAEGTENMYIYATMLSAVSKGVKQKLNFKEQSKLSPNDKRLVYAAHANSTGRRNELLMTWEQFLTEESPFQHKKNQELISIIEETKVCIASGPCLPPSIDEKNARVLKYKDNKSLILYPSLSSLYGPEISGALYDIKKSINSKDSWKELCSVDNSYKEYIFKCLNFVKFNPMDWERYLNTPVDEGSTLTNRNILEEIESICKASASKLEIKRELLTKLHENYICVISGFDGLPKIGGGTTYNVKTHTNGYIVFPSSVNFDTEFEWGEALSKISEYISKLENFRYYYYLSTEEKKWILSYLCNTPNYSPQSWEDFLRQTNGKYNNKTNQAILDKFVFCVVEGDGKDLPKLDGSNTRTLICENGIIIYPSIVNILNRNVYKLALYTLSEHVNNRAYFRKYSDLGKYKGLVDNALKYLKDPKNQTTTWEEFLKRNSSFTRDDYTNLTATNQELIDDYRDEKGGS